MSADKPPLSPLSTSPIEPTPVASPPTPSSSDLGPVEAGLSNVELRPVFDADGWSDSASSPTSSLPPAPSEAIETILLTWNPALWPEDKLEPYVRLVEQTGSTELQWSLGVRKTPLAKGTRVYLLRQGKEPRGLVGKGVVTGSTERGAHFAGRGEEKTTFYAAITWSELSLTPIVGRDQLLADPNKRKHPWNSPGGGIRLEPDVIADIERLWPSDNRLFAKTLSDLDHRNDFVGVGADVEALSTLLSIKAIEPPLSLAVFGEWGSGKSFLMHKVRQRIDILETASQHANQTARADTPEALSAYCGSILQIEFNAWHFRESNLWASLVNTIFEAIHAKLVSASIQPSDTDAIDAYFKTFETAQAARAEAEVASEVARTERNEAASAVDQASGVLGNAQANLEQKLGESLWKTLTGAIQDPAVEEKSGALREALTAFGFGDSLASAATLAETLSQFRSVSGRAKQILGSLLATREGLIGAFVVCSVAALATIAAVYWNAPVLSLGLTASAALGWLAERATNARKYLDAIKRFDDWFVAVKDAEAHRLAQDVEAARAALAIAENKVVEANRRLVEAERNEAQAVAALKMTTAREQMRLFVEKRVTDQTYAQHLGLISLIRRDFEGLSNLMDRAQQSADRRLAAEIATTLHASIPKLDRIILYTDDLDRCAPERVVEVLEAIHLLLAFPLFVVVVAASPSWVVQSLRHRYPHIADQTESVHVALDYLEKIFQIPFWVRPLSRNASARLAQGLFAFPAPAEAKVGAPVTALVASADEAAGATDANKPAPVQELAEKLAAVEASATEQSFIRELSPYLGGSPRRIKRFVNTYRLFKASLSKTELRAYLNTAAAHTIVLALLAIITCAPELADASVEHLTKTGPDPFGGNLPAGVNARERADAAAILEMISPTISSEITSEWAPRVLRYSFRLTPPPLERAGIEDHP